MAQVLQCEVNIMKLTNLDTSPPSGKLFIRYYVYVGGGRRIRIDTREISSAGDPHLDEKTSLECVVPSSSVKKAICARNVVFELRWRGGKSCFGMKAKSKALGRAEVAWGEGMLVEKRASFVVQRPLTVTEGCKPPTILVRMGIKVRDLELREKRRDEHEGCTCEGCGWIGSEEDMFVAATAATLL